MACTRDRENDEVCEESPIETEIESLEAIYINELTYSRKSDGTVNTIELLLHPATGDDVTKQFVCMTLIFTPSPKYPDEIPTIEIKNPRGLGEEEIASLVEDMIAKAHECVGEVMLFTLIEMAKDSLTDGNIPHCPCVVCLEHFHEDDLFHRTSCYHYFHNRCLNRYLEHRRKQIEEEEREEASERRHIEFSEEEKVKIIGCPVCRAPLGEDSLSVTSEILDCMGQQEVEETPFVLPPEMKEQQAKMADLFAQQKAKGGIIDLEQEKNKYLVNEENRWSLPSMTTAEASLGSPAGRAESETQLHQRSQNGIHSRGGRKDGRRSAQGRHHPGEKDYNSHNRHREGGKGHRLRYHNPHHHRQQQQQQQHGHGRGTPWRGGSGNRGNRDGAEKSQTAQGLERPVMKSSKRDEKDGFLSRTVEGENTANTDKRRKEDDNVMKSGEDTQLPMRISQSVEEKKERSEPNSRYNEENENIHFPRGQVRETNQNVQKVFHGRQRGGGRFSDDTNQTQHKKNYCSEHGDMDADHPRLRREYENTRRYEAERENKGPQMRGPRKDGRRGRGRGRFSDFDDMYFNSKREDDEVSAGGENCERQSKSKKDPTLRERASGCRESENRDQRRNNEYDEDEDRNEQSHRRVAGSNRGPRHQRRGGAEMKYKRNEGVQGSQTRGCDIQHQMQERLHEDQRISIQNKTATSRKVGRYDENVDNSLDEKIQVEFEVNRRWRRLTYGYGESSKHTGGQATENNKNNHRSHCNVNNDKEKSLETKQKSGISGGCSLTPDSDTSHLNRIYVGYDEVGEEEEDWDEERFAYAYERRHIKLEDLGKYDKFRRKDYQLRGKKVEERDQRQRLLDEEDRRLRREEADAERREQSSSDSKPTKSVLELFQEKQEAKKREADALRHEQQQQQAQISKKTESETKPDADRQRKNSISSQAFVSTSPSSSSQDYQSQSSTEEPAQEDWQNCHDPHAMDSVVKPPKPGRDLENEKSTLVAQISDEIQWVGVKKQPDPGDAHSGSLKEQDPDADGEGREDPYLDALAEREERRRVESRKKKAKRYRPNVESDEPVLETQAPDVPALPIVSDRSETRPDGTKTTESLSASSQTREQSQHMISTVAKQKPLTKAPPLKLSTRNKQSTNSHAAKELCAKLANSGSSDLTKDELANLKALYGTEAVLEYKEVKNGTSTPNSLMPEASNKNKMFPKSAGFNEMSHGANMRKNQQDGILSQDLRPASLPQAVNSTDNQNREDLKTKVVPQSKVKPMKKAPPLNLKQVSVKPSPCDKIESNAIIQDANNLKNGGGQDMTKVMKYLGIGLNDDFFTVDSTKS